MNLSVGDRVGMNKIIRRAVSIAKAEVARGTSVVMILFPTSLWVSRCATLCSTLGMDFDRERIFIRASTVHCELKSLAVEVLIITPLFSNNWSDTGILLARERTRGVADSTIIRIET